MATSRRKSHDSSRQVSLNRYLLVIAFFAVWILGIGARLVYLQVTKHEEYSKMALDQRRDKIRTKTLRGTIYDRDARPLAVSINTRSLTADPTMVEDVEGTAKKLAKPLGLNQQALLKELRDSKSKGSRYLAIARKLDDETVIAVNRSLGAEASAEVEMPAAGLFWKEEQRRSYPNNSLAAHILGFTNSDDVGQAGIEQFQEESLRGSVVKGWRVRDRLGRVYESQEERRDPPNDIVLTISKTIQFKTEKALAEGVKAAGAKSAMAVVMVPQTGEILAMANYPTFDPNVYAEAKPELWMNRSIQSVYAPGSVFKLITYGSALEEGKIEIEQKIDCSRGSIDVAGHVFKDSHRIGLVTYREAMAQSSNVAAIRTGLGLGREKFYNYARGFGFGQQTGIELPGELRGQFRSPEKWHGSSLGSLSIGYEIGVTALQMATAFATIANDGVRPQPFIVKEIRREDGTVVSATEPKGAQVVSKETAAEVRKMLREVIVSGTGKRAQLDGYTSAGKTGTAWKYNPQLKKVDSGKYVASFIGFAPAENPAVVIAVVMDEPTSGGGAGGTVSAPVFKNIAEQILPELSIVPDATIKSQAPTALVPEVVEDDNPRGFDEQENVVDAPLKNPSPSPAETDDKKAKEGGTKPTDKKPAAALPKVDADRRKTQKKEDGKRKT